MDQRRGNANENVTCNICGKSSHDKTSVCTGTLITIPKWLYSLYKKEDKK
ncbi:MAG: hypothetical protein KatS3mg002_0213 [Candidatus Woesearchaeota archaeon]|nr:MAG: hypothetical protein KatS3mg002_0213 [Candidatus Woesearchaeota archaeon]